jgi:hypothetical protein
MEAYSPNQIQGNTVHLPKQQLLFFLFRGIKYQKHNPGSAGAPNLLAISAIIVVVTSLIALYRPADTSSALVKVLAILVSYLTAGFTATILTALLETRVQIGADDALVQLSAANVLETVEGVLVCVVFDKTESAGRLAETVEAHDEPFDLAALGKKLIDLLFGCVERPRT